MIQDDLQSDTMQCPRHHLYSTYCAYAVYIKWYPAYFWRVDDPWMVLCVELDVMALHNVIVGSFLCHELPFTLLGRHEPRRVLIQNIHDR